MPQVCGIITCYALSLCNGNRTCKILGGEMTHENFLAFMESVIIPQKTANPNDIRLDGRTSGGNRIVAGMFRHHNKVWKVHSDTRYEPLMLAYESLKEDKSGDPFVEEPTRNGNCLTLKDSIQKSMEKPRFKHLYIYEA